jgi:hypothetical protein
MEVSALARAYVSRFPVFFISWDAVTTDLNVAPCTPGERMLPGPWRQLAVLVG